MMDFTKKLLKKLAKEITGKLKLTFMGNLLDFSKPWKRISIHDTLLENFGKDLYELDYDELVNTARRVGI
jgi:lysine--tRNA ligase